MLNKRYQLITLYYNEKGKEEVGLYTVSARYLFLAKSILRAELLKKDCVFKNCILLDQVERVGFESEWSDAKKLRFTELLKIGLENGTNISINNAILFVYKQMFDPLIYFIFIKLNNGEKLSDILANFPKIFDDFYVNVIRSYFDKSGDQIEGLNEIIGFFNKKIELRRKIIGGSMMSIISLVFGILAGLVLDMVSYENLKTQYNGYPLPAGVELIHTVVQFLSTNFLYIIILIFMLNQILKIFEFNSLKVGWGKILLSLPIVGKIQKIEHELLFINMYIAMDKAHLSTSSILKIIGDSMTNYYIKGIVYSIRDDFINNGVSVGELMDSKYRFFSEDIIIAFNSKDLKNELLKLKRNYMKISEFALDKAVKTAVGVLLLFSVVLGGGIVVSYMMGTMGVNEIIKKESSV